MGPFAGGTKPTDLGILGEISALLWHGVRGRSPPGDERTVPLYAAPRAAGAGLRARGAVIGVRAAFGDGAAGEGGALCGVFSPAEPEEGGWGKGEESGVEVGKGRDQRRAPGRGWRGVELGGVGGAELLGAVLRRMRSGCSIGCRDVSPAGAK